MLSALYFSIIFGLSSKNNIPESVRPQFLECIFLGRLRAAKALVSAWIDETETTLSRPPVHAAWQVQGDLQLLTGVMEEAEECYRRSQKTIRGSKSALRIASCRNTAWMALFRYRLPTALSCFSQITKEMEANSIQLAEAHFGIACTLYEMGRVNETIKALDSLAQSIERLKKLPDQTAPQWIEVLEVLRVDVTTQAELRTTTSLDDHVYWRSGQIAAYGSNAHLPKFPKHDTTISVLRVRSEYLKSLHSTMREDVHAVSDLYRHIEWAANLGIIEYLRAVRLECTLATLVGRFPNHASTILQPLNHTVRIGTAGRAQLEYLYCAAKVFEFQGRVSDMQQTYRRYALVAMQSLREDANIRLIANESVATSSRIDHIGVRLPVRYRAAYLYLLENLEYSDLSIGEVAASIGVTPRALQLTFKQYIGLSPAELIRKKRMEHIREDLLNEKNVSQQSVRDIARKWGVENRSSLISSYRAQFHETPSDTLKRSGRPSFSDAADRGSCHGLS